MKASGARILISYLEQEGVDIIFGIPGGHLLTFYDTLFDSSITPILAKHESGAAFMAAGYAQVGQRLGVCCATVGPGATNLVSGVTAAYMQSLPVLVITAQVGMVNMGKGALQEAAGYGRTISQTQLLGQCTKSSEMVTRVDRLPGAIRQALRTAFNGRPGPVHLDIPADVFRAEVEAEVWPVERYRPTQAWLPPQVELERAVLALARAVKPAMLVGGGARDGGAPEAIRALAERYTIPVATTLQGKGLLPEDHPLSLGCMGLYGTHAANRYMRSGLDTLLAIGTSLHEFTTHVWDPALQPTETLIQIDVDPMEIGKNYAVDIALPGRAEIIVPALVSIAEQDPTEPTRSMDHLADLKSSTAFFADPQMTSDAEPSKPQRVMAELRRALPDDIIVLTDIGNSLTWVERCFQARRPNSVFSLGGLAAMGSGTAAVVGAKLAAGDRPTVVVCGDGDFYMHGMEVMTAVSHGVAAIWVIMENGMLGMIKDTQVMNYKGRVTGTSFFRADLVKMTQAMGADAYHAARPAEIGPAIQSALEAGRPAVISVVVDADELPPTKPRMLAMERSLGLPPPHKSIGMGAVKALLGMLRER